MSDVAIRRLERRYQETGSQDDADRLIAALRRLISVQPASDEFEDMGVASYWLGELPGFENEPAYEDSNEFVELTDWIERNASFSYARDPQHWEFILYIGRFDDRTLDIGTGYGRLEPNIAPNLVFNYQVDPTPPILISIIQRAVDQGFGYISFHIEG